MTTKKSVKKKSTDEPSLKLVQTSKCQSISDKSTLTYNIGVDDKGQFHIRVYGNTGGGFFSNEWVSMKDITAILSEASDESPITSINLIPLFRGKSVNTPGYLLAVLVNEKLLSALPEKKRQFTYTGEKTLSAKVTKRKAKK